jgi:hypothetical protein
MIEGWCMDAITTNTRCMHIILTLINLCFQIEKYGTRRKIKSLFPLDIANDIANNILDIPLLEVGEDDKLV